MNHRGWIVLASIASHDLSLCVDVFEDPAGGYGFELFRSDPEDAGRWTPIGGYAARRFASATETADAAATVITWLTDSEGWPALVAYLASFKDDRDPPSG